MSQAVILDTGAIKAVKSESYNYVFNKETGFFARWGKKQEDNPSFSPYGPELLDIELSVNGCPNQCPFCYKENTNRAATNMSLETFKEVMSNIPKTVTQVAFGITGIQTNPEFFDIMRYTREELGIIPNFTMSGIDLTPELAKRAVAVVGAIAVSVYESDKNVGYNAIKLLTDLGLTQVNIHLMVSQETYKFVHEVLADIKSDARLAKLNAIVFLGIKPKGRAIKGESYTPLDTTQFCSLIEYCLQHDIRMGFDSCSAPKFEYNISRLDISEEQRTLFKECSESCESGLFSLYIDVHGRAWPCSFCENELEEWPIMIQKDTNFMKDVWNAPQTLVWRSGLIQTEQEYGCRMCPVYPEINPAGVEL
jgi:MoaA/NifB/PqqE/SkfB family radical SAM enzyme